MTETMGKSFEIYHGRWEEFIDEILEVDHVITDAPFCDRVHCKPLRGGGHSPGGLYETELSFEAITPEALVPAMLHIARRWFITFCSMEHIGSYAAAADDYHDGCWVRGAVWVKPDSTPQFSGDRPGMWGESIAIMHVPGKKQWNAGGKRGIYQYNHCRESDRFHETQKPLPLMIEIIEDFTDPEDLILDPFMGSGTTGVACLLTGRRFIGVEMQDEYFDKASRRLVAATQGLKLDDFEAGQGALFPTLEPIQLQQGGQND